MPKLSPLKAKEIIKIFLKIGFYKHHQTGSHIQLRHEQKLHLRVTIPRHDKFELPASVVGSILKQAELNKETFIELIKK